jgi:hypothetical protein
MTAGSDGVPDKPHAERWVKHRVVRSESGAQLRQPMHDFDEDEYVDMLSDETVEKDRSKRRIRRALPRKREVNPQILQKALSSAFPSNARCHSFPSFFFHFHRSMMHFES